MAELITAVNDLLKGKKTEVNFRLYTDGLSSLYERMSLLRLSMNYFTFAEIYEDLSVNDKKHIQKQVSDVQKLIKEAILNEEYDITELLSRTDSLRNEITGYMEALTAYIDRLQLCEYILNRTEYKFNNSVFSEDYYNGKFEKDIVHYVTSEKDNSVINLKITQIVGELPMRLSQNKFSDLLKNALSLYKGSQKSSVNDFVYMIRTAGTLYTPKNASTKFPELQKFYKEFNSLDFDNITEEQYKLFRKKLDNITNFVQDYSDSYVMLTEVINDIYSIILSENNLHEINEVDKLKIIIKKSYDVIEGTTTLDSDSQNMFLEFEGLQEKIAQMIYPPENAMDEIISTNESAIKEFDFCDKFDRLKKMAKLQSTSTFASLHNEEGMDEIADELYIETALNKLNDEFRELFDKNSKIYKRAVMSAVLSNLPVFFNNLNEFSEYVHVALMQCTDKAEKQACMSLINMMIKSE